MFISSKSRVCWEELGPRPTVRNHGQTLLNITTRHKTHYA